MLYFLLIVFSSTGAMLIAVSLPMLRRRVKPNPWYGLRVAATMADEWVWYEANAKSGRDMVVLGVVQIVLAVALCLVRGITETSYVAANLAFALGGLVLCSVVGWRRANQLRLQREAGGQK